jgi:hypothetical protein
MTPASQPENGEWLSRRATFAAAIAAWAGGFVLTGFAAGYMQNATTRSQAAEEASASVARTEGTPCEVVSIRTSTLPAFVDTPELESAVFMPEDIIVQQAPRTGIMEKQKPSD